LKLSKKKIRKNTRNQISMKNLIH